MDNWVISISACLITSATFIFLLHASEYNPGAQKSLVKRRYFHYTIQFQDKGKQTIKYESLICGHSGHIMLSVFILDAQ